MTTFEMVIAVNHFEILIGHLFPYFGRYLGDNMAFVIQSAISSKDFT